MKIKKIKTKVGNSILVENRWQMYDDGSVRDNKKGVYIPQWIFEFRDFCIETEKKRLREFIESREKKWNSTRQILGSVKNELETFELCLPKKLKNKK